MLASVMAGNSDNKLTQQEWSEFVAELNVIVYRHERIRHFFGGSENWQPWQNVCWVSELYETPNILDSLKDALRDCRKKYRQDSVCVLAGEPMFV